MRIIYEKTKDSDPLGPPILIENDIDDEPGPPDIERLKYTNATILGKGVPPEKSWKMKSRSCSCSRSGLPCGQNPRCKCIKRQQLRIAKYCAESAPSIYNERGQLQFPNIQMLVNECNRFCGCGDECNNRVVQKGRKVAIKIAKTAAKGWGKCLTSNCFA